MHGKTGLVALRIDLPQLLDANAVTLRVFARVKLVAGNDLFAQVAARAFGKHRVLGMQLHAELEAFCGLTIFAHPHVAGGHAFDGPCFGVEHFGRGKAWEYFNAQGLGLLGQPARHVAQADDVVAVVLKAFGQQPIGRADAGGFSEKHEGVIGHRLVQGRAHGLPVGEQFGDGTRVHDRARQNVCARL